MESALESGEVAVGKKRYSEIGWLVQGHKHTSSRAHLPWYQPRTVSSDGATFENSEAWALCSEEERKQGKGWFLKAESSPFLTVQILSHSGDGLNIHLRDTHGTPPKWMNSLLPPEVLPLTHQTKTCRKKILGDGALAMVLKYSFNVLCLSQKKINMKRG